MFCCFPVCCKKKTDKSTSPINIKENNDYTRLDEPFYDIINNIDNNSKIYNECPNNIEVKYNIDTNTQRDAELNNLIKEHNKLEYQYQELEIELNKKQQYIYYLENKINTELKNVKKHNINNDLSHYKNKINELEKTNNFIKIDYNKILDNNLNYRNTIEELQKNINIKNNFIKEYEIKKNELLVENQNLCKKNNKLKNLNNILNEKNKSLLEEKKDNISENMYLTEKNNRLKKRLSI